MEQIKDMVTLRAFAVKVAASHPRTLDIVSSAKEIKSYILGYAQFPEVYDEKAQIESWKKIIFDAMPKDMQTQWFKPEDIQPKDGAKMLVHIKESDKVYFGSYDGSQWMIEIDNGLVTEVDGDFTVVAWLPIPKYKG